MNRCAVWFPALLFLASCSADLSTDEQDSLDRPLFSEVAPEQSGIHFSNPIIEDFHVNVINYDYLYNGGGVGVGDFDMDGLPDLFFTSNQGVDHLYHNLGGFEFTEIGKAAGISQTPAWSTGVSVADVNGDDLLDIYVCRSGPSANDAERTNELYINTGDLRFEEKAAEYGLNYAGHSTQALFVDYDHDSDLDMYLLTHPTNFGKSVSGAQIKQALEQGLLEQDRLYRNDGRSFTDVTEQAGIFDFAFGLGVAAGDLNDDGWPDIYVSNDYDEGDCLYINQQDGTFKNEITERLRHTANYGMGCDIADFNNDGLNDIISVDMAFETHERAKRNMASMNEERFYARVKLGWHYQYMHNMLHVNDGMGSFQEIAQLAGVHKTDWSWSSLFADFDLDGKKDLFITNGYKRDTKDNDLQTNVRQLQDEKGDALLVEDILNLLPSTKTSNYMFRNGGDYGFDNVSKDWGVDRPMNSNGAAYADLDNDGDLDLIINNVDEKAALFRNNASGNWLKVKALKEDGKVAAGCKMCLYERLMVGDFEISLLNGCWEPQACRGFQSSVENVAFFGLDSDEAEEVGFKPTGTFDLKVTWQDGEVEEFSALEPNQEFIAKRGEGRLIEDEEADNGRLLVEELSGKLLGGTHREPASNDFSRDILLPHTYSDLGPPLLEFTHGNGSRLLLGAGDNSSTSVFDEELQRLVLDGSFYTQPRDDRFLLSVDLNRDAAPDLIAVSNSGIADGRSGVRIEMGGAEYSYWTDLDEFTSGKSYSCVVQMPETDTLLLFGTVIAGQYPLSQPSIAVHAENGLTQPITDLLPDLSGYGFINDAAFIGKDIIAVGEWMSPVYLAWENEQFVDRTADMIPDDLEGWWQTVEVGDFDLDGDEDIALGNWGWNNKFGPSPDSPLEVFAGDMDHNGTHDIVLAKYEGSTLYPVRGKECSTEQMPFISEKFADYETFANADLVGIYTQQQLDASHQRVAKTFSSGVLWNEGGRFEFETFPTEVQFAPCMAIEMETTADGTRLWTGGNRYGAEVETTRYDAGNGVVLTLKEDRSWSVTTSMESGFYIPRNVRDIELIETQEGRKLLFVSNNKGPLQVFEIMN